MRILSRVDLLSLPPVASTSVPPYPIPLRCLRPMHRRTQFVLHVPRQSDESLKRNLEKDSLDSKKDPEEK